MGKFYAYSSRIILCIVLLAFLCSCNRSDEWSDINIGLNTVPTNSSQNNSFDFSASGLVVQTEQYGKCKIEVASQEPSATVVISGKNLCGGAPGTSLPKQYNGITYTEAEDGRIMVTGTAEKNSLCYVAGKWGESTTNSDRIFLPEGTYTLSGCPKGGSDSSYRLRLAVVDQEGKATFHHDLGEGVTFTIWESAYVGVCIQILADTEVDGLVFAPQLEIGNQATQYEAYRGENRTVKLNNGVGILEVAFSADAENQKAYTFVSNGDSLSVSGFGTMKNCVQPLWHASQPHFALIDDDGKDEVYTILLPLLRERGIKFSVSIIPSKLNKKGYLTTEQLQEVVEAGTKVMCHSKDHKNLKNTITTYEGRVEQIVGGKKMLEDMGFNVDTMVYPHGSYDDEVLAITKSAYKYGISTAGETAWREQRYNEQPLNLYSIERINIGSYYDGQTAEEKAQALEDAKKNIDVCIEKNYLCVIMTHVGDAGEDGVAQIIELLDYIESKGYKIDDFDTAIQAHIEPNQE